MLLLIDNYDSFTYNLADMPARLGVDVRVVYNDALTVADVAALKPQGIIISPGPGTPDQTGISQSVIQHFGIAQSIPILGVCLGHQLIGQMMGAVVHKGLQPMHGKVRPVFHDESGIFEGIPQGVKVMRYHSLVVNEATLPPTLRVNARSAEGEVMALYHTQYPLTGVQFHPESILTECGIDMIRNWLSHNALLPPPGTPFGEIISGLKAEFEPKTPTAILALQH